MKKIIIITIVIFVAVVGIVAISSNKTPTTQPTSTSFPTVQSDVSSGAKLYDVRTSQEYASGHFKNAENWSLQDMQAGKLPDVAKTTKLYVYCQSGNRSSQAAQLLKDAGFTNIIDLGGLQDVKKAGGTME